MDDGWRVGPGRKTVPAIDVARRIEPGTMAILDRLTRWDLTSIETIRSSYTAAGSPPVPGDPRVERSDEVIGGLNGLPDVAVRWYRPRGAAGPLPCLVWLHGGAYIMGTLDENDDRLDRMVIELGCAVVSVDWRLAPEHPYPEGLDDAATVWCRVHDDAGAFGVDHLPHARRP
jgi:triacylglycerol lipase